MKFKQRLSAQPVRFSRAMQYPSCGRTLKVQIHPSKDEP